MHGAINEARCSVITPQVHQSARTIFQMLEHIFRLQVINAANRRHSRRQTLRHVARQMRWPACIGESAGKTKVDNCSHEGLLPANQQCVKQLLSFGCHGFSIVWHWTSPHHRPRVSSRLLVTSELRTIRAWATGHFGLAPSSGH